MVPESVDLQIASMDVKDTNFQIVDKKEKTCGWFTNFWKLWLLVFLTLCAIGVLIYLIITQTGDFEDKRESLIADCH